MGERWLTRLQRQRNEDRMLNELSGREVTGD